MLFDKKLIAFSTISIAIITIYANTIYHPFIWDDLEIIVNNTFIKDIRNIAAIFTHSVFGEKWTALSFYRPIQSASYILDYYLWGMNPQGFHLTSISIHILNSYIVYLLLIQFKFKRILGLLITLLYCLHPIHIENISYLSGRGDLLYSLCAFSIMLIITKASTNKWNPLWITLLFITGLLCKENIIGLPIIALIYHYFIKTPYLKTLLFNTVIYGGYACVRIMYPVSKKSLSYIAEASILERLYTLPYIIIEYLKLLIFPYPLHMEYHTVIKSIINPYSGLFVVLLISLVLLIKKSSNRAWMIIGLSWFIFGLAPVTHIIIPLASTLREHWLSFAGFGIIIIYTFLIQCYFEKYKRIILPLLLIQIILLSLTTLHRNSFWGNEEKLYKNDLIHEPKSFVMLNNLGVYYYKKKQYDKALEYFLISIQQSPNQSYDMALNNAGVIFEYQKKPQLAEDHYIKSIQYGQLDLAYKNLLRLYKNTNQAQKHEQLQLLINKNYL